MARKGGVGRSSVGEGADGALWLSKCPRMEKVINGERVTLHLEADFRSFVSPRTI